MGKIILTVLKLCYKKVLCPQNVGQCSLQGSADGLILALDASNAFSRPVKIVSKPRIVERNFEQALRVSKAFSSCN